LTVEALKKNNSKKNIKILNPKKFKKFKKTNKKSSTEAANCLLQPINTFSFVYIFPLYKISIKNRQP